MSAPTPEPGDRGVVEHPAHTSDHAQTSRIDLHSAVPTVVVDAAHAAVARATAREVAVHESYDRARNVLRARERRRALVPLTREMFSTHGHLDGYVGRSMPALAWGLPVSRRGHLLAVISPTASAITPGVRATTANAVIVVASFEEQERIRRATHPAQRFVLLSVRVPEPLHEAIVDFARRTSIMSGVAGGSARPG